MENPHPYLRFYLGWKRWNRPDMPVLPFSGGWEDWPLEESTAFEIIEDLIKEEERRKDFLESIKQKGPGPLKGR